MEDRKLDTHSNYQKAGKVTFEEPREEVDNDYFAYIATFVILCVIVIAISGFLGIILLVFILCLLILWAIYHFIQKKVKPLHVYYCY